MSFSFKFAPLTLKNGTVIPAVERQFESAAKMDDWFQKESARRARLANPKKKRRNRRGKKAKDKTEVQTTSTNETK